MKGERKQNSFDGSCAVLGLNIEDFSSLSEGDQINAIQHVYRWINESLANHSLSEEDYRWSPAGSGGFLTFKATKACRKAIDVGFTICEKTRIPDWRPENRDPLKLSLGLHAGIVTEGDDLRKGANVWGVGINIASRILSVAAPSQLLISRQYYETFIGPERELDYEIGVAYWHTVKHGVGIEVMNVNRYNLCLTTEQANNRRWHAIGDLWRQTIEDYKHLVHDAMKSGDPVAAVASSKFLLELKAEEPVRELCHMIGRSELRPTVEYPPQSHILFSQMPPDLLYKVIEDSQPRLFSKGEIIFEQGDPALSCFFPISGTLLVDLPGTGDQVAIPKGEMTGEFSLWIPNISRTARVHAMDDGLFLEIRIDRFRKYLEENPDVASVIDNIIKRRIVENALTSKLLFPDLTTAFKEDLSMIPAVSAKLPAGAEFDLTDKTHFLFSGKVEIDPPDSASMVIEACGSFDALGVLGIVSEIGEPDGPRARVLEESVAVSVPHDFLRDIQDKSDIMRNVWNGICGQRLGHIKRRTSSKDITV
jgi:CRP-like cAMP-binding protein